MSTQETIPNTPAYRTVQAYDAVRNQTVTVKLGPATADNTVDEEIVAKTPATPSQETSHNTYSRAPERSLHTPRFVKYLGKNALLAASLVLTGAYIGSTAVHQLEGDRFQDPVEFGQTLHKGYKATDKLIDMIAGSDNNVNIKGEQ